MRIPDYGDYTPADITARARIRDAAMRQFAADGFKATTIRSVAAEAGVSAGLVQRHFGTKDGLRAACDEHAIAALLEEAERSLSEEAADADFLGRLYDASRPSLAYLARALVEGSPVAGDLFDKGAEATERFLSRTWPERFSAGSSRTRDVAAVMSAMHMSTIVLHEHLSRRLGIDVFDRPGASRLARGIAEVHLAMGEFAGSPAGERLTSDPETDQTEPR